MKVISCFCCNVNSTKPFIFRFIYFCIAYTVLLYKNNNSLSWLWSGPKKALEHWNVLFESCIKMVYNCLIFCLICISVHSMPLVYKYSLRPLYITGIAIMPNTAITITTTMYCYCLNIAGAGLNNKDDLGPMWERFGSFVVNSCIHL